MSSRLASAEWADPAQVENDYPYKTGSIWLGSSLQDPFKQIGQKDDRHVCLVSGSRGGKGTTAIVNNLCLWPGSVVVVDPKGENATVAARRRGKGSPETDGLGQAVYVLDPFKQATVPDDYRASFNPLDVLDPNGDETIDEAGRIADALVVINDGKDPYWDESARSLVKGLILHVLTAEVYEGRRNLVTVRQLITRGDWETVELWRTEGREGIPGAQQLLWLAVANNPACYGVIAGIGESFLGMSDKAPKQFDSVLQVANRNTEFIDSPAMQRCLQTSTLQLSWLKTSQQGISVFLCLPQRYMSTHYRWLRMMITLTATEMEKTPGRPKSGYPVLMILDEFAGLKRMEVIENAVAQIAGYGVKLFFVLQSLEQLKATYKDNWETFLSNSGLKIFFNVEDHFSREYVSKLIGETEVVREVSSRNEASSVTEGINQGGTRSTTHTTGTNTSESTSQTHGTNTGTSTSKSGGSNTSTSTTHGTSENQAWHPGLFRMKVRGERITGSFSDSETEGSGTNKGWSKTRSRGVSDSDTTGTTYGTSTSDSYTTGESWGTSSSTSQSHTSGTSETVHRRPLISPDEIGQVFSRIDQQDHPGFPGMALVLVSGARPFAVKRENYFESLYFLGCFGPHPDHPFTKSHTISYPMASLMKRWSALRGLPKIANANVDVEVMRLNALPGDVIPAGFVLAQGAQIHYEIHAPRTGKFRNAPGIAKQISNDPSAEFFSMRFRDAVPAIDPFEAFDRLLASPDSSAGGNTLPPPMPDTFKKEPVGFTARQWILILMVVGSLISILSAVISALSH